MTPSPRILIALIVSSMFFVPAANLAAAGRDFGAYWREPSLLYNVDILAQQLALALMPWGISIAPEKVVIGKGQWLFLGDSYHHAITEERRPAMPPDVAFGRRVKAATASWDTYFRRHGVGLFKILVGPNKSSIYPEYLPGWMKASQPSPFEIFLREAGENYIDLRPVLRRAKEASPAPLYYRADTHWNYRAAAIAFHELARHAAPEAPDLRWPLQEDYGIRRESLRTGGDLSYFLHAGFANRDVDPQPVILEKDAPTTWTELDSGKVIYDGPIAAVPRLQTTIVVHSSRALNQRKVLWLRDSYGEALSPFMSYTFSDVLQCHWLTGLQPGALARLVDRWKPDYVFITVVERDARDELFAGLPPPAGEAPGAAR